MKSSSLNHFSSCNFFFSDFIPNPQTDTIKEILILQINSKKQKILCADVIDVATGSISGSSCVAYFHDIPKQIVFNANQEIYAILQSQIEAFHLSLGTFQISYKYSQKLPCTISIQQVIPIHFCVLPVVIAKCTSNKNFSLFHVERGILIPTSVEYCTESFAMFDSSTIKIYLFSGLKLESFDFILSIPTIVM